MRRLAWVTGDIPAGPVDMRRDAQHWHSDGDGNVACDLCYRGCVLDDGQDGTCGFRGARNGRMELHSHGIITAAVRQVRGYGPDPFVTYKPGQTSVFFGGQQCTSACTFCMSTDIVHAPDRISWAAPPSMLVPPDSAWYGRRAMLDPATAIQLAEHHRASSVEFGINEPTLSFEWTLDVAKRAKSRGLDVVVESNGFTQTAAIRELAPYVDAVDIGTKGSLDPDFYADRMRSPGAVPAVLEALTTWREADVHVIVGDLVAPPHWQNDWVFESAARSFYGQVRDRLGPLTPVLISPINPPGPLGTSRVPYDMLVQSPDEETAYKSRLRLALQLAREAGLPYAHVKSPDWTIVCHGCGGPLLHIAQDCTGSASGVCCQLRGGYCTWRHEQHVTSGRCDHCGIEVPIIALTADELARERSKIATVPDHLKDR